MCLPACLPACLSVCPLASPASGNVCAKSSEAKSLCKQRTRPYVGFFALVGRSGAVRRLFLLFLRFAFLCAGLRCVRRFRTRTTDLDLDALDAPAPWSTAHVRAFDRPSPPWSNVRNTASLPPPTDQTLGLALFLPPPRTASSFNTESDLDVRLLVLRRSRSRRDA